MGGLFVFAIQKVGLYGKRDLGSIWPQFTIAIQNNILYGKHMQPSYPLNLQTTYQDLVTAKLDLRSAEIVGRPVLRMRNGKGYWYDQYRVGTDVCERYFAEDSESTRARLKLADQIKGDLEGINKRTSQLVAILRSARYLTFDQQTGSLLSAMARAGVFRLGGTIIGTHAFRLFAAELGRPLGSSLAYATDDIDIASFEKLSIGLNDRIDPPMGALLGNLKFDAIPSLGKVGHSWRWKQSAGTGLVEFLTPSFEADEGIRQLPALGVSAHSFHFLNFLIADPIPAVGLYRNGVLVQVPRPERYAVHKMIVAGRRKDTMRLKAQKDMLQAEALVEVMIEDRPYEIESAFRDAWSRGPAWRELLDKALHRSKMLRQTIGAFRDG